MKCNIISKGTGVQFPPQENFSLRNYILQTGYVVNSASYLRGSFPHNNTAGAQAERSLPSDFKARMSENSKQQFPCRQARTLVTIPTILPRITTSVPKIKKTKD